MAAAVSIDDSESTDLQREVIMASEFDETRTSFLLITGLSAASKKGAEARLRDLLVRYKKDEEILESIDVKEANYFKDTDSFFAIMKFKTPQFAADFRETVYLDCLFARTITAYYLPSPRIDTIERTLSAARLPESYSHRLIQVGFQKDTLLVWV